MRVYRPLDDLLTDEKSSQRRRLLWGVAALSLAGAAAAFAFWPRASEPVGAGPLGRSAHVYEEDLALSGPSGAPSPDGPDGDDARLQESQGDPLHVVGELERNQTLFHALKARGLAPERINPVVGAMDGVFDFRRSRPGDDFEARLDLDGNILEFRYQTSPEDIYVSRLVGDRYEAEKIDVPRHLRLEHVEGTLTGSLFQSIDSLGEEPELARQFMDLFSFDFDFTTDSRPGDRFRMVVEKIFLEDDFYRYGDILVAEYHTGDGQNLRAYFFDDDGEGEGAGEYYDGEGRSLRRMFIKTPVKDARISSVFDRHRLHPVLGVRRPHLGVDYAAPPGTPIMAIADGTITFRAWKGGNGNFVVIRHADGYESVYAHLLRFNTRYDKGDSVRQKTIIGYVGSTGLSTGPHLHFGIRRNGTYIDPATIDTSRGDPLRGRALERFAQERARLDGLLEQGPALEETAGSSPQDAEASAPLAP